MQLTMLSQIFPRHVIEYLSGLVPSTDGVQAADISTLARSHENVTILFMDIVGFTTMSKEVAPQLVMTVRTQTGNQGRLVYTA